MPNTLAHIGIQTLVTRGVLRSADIKWIWAACIIPDLPWIAQRAIRGLLPEISMIDLRLYAIVQSVLLFCLVFSGVLACFSRHPGRTFGILAGGCLMHLLLDALQTKWANGVVLFAPMHWNLLNFGLFWPENGVTLFLTGLGAVVALYAFWRMPKHREDLCWPRGRKLVAAMILGVVYVTFPLFLMPQAEASDLHYTKTLREVSERPGRPIGIDRNRIDISEGTAYLTAWTGERFRLHGDMPSQDGIISLRGRFLDAETVEVSQFHHHRAGLRDHASYVGLGLIALWWMLCMMRHHLHPDDRGGYSRSHSRAFADWMRK